MGLMKRFFIFVLVLVCLMGLVACKGGDEASQNNAKPAYFVAEVLEAYETGCLVEITDVGNYGGLAVGTPVHVSTHIENCPDIAVGDHIKVVFDGTVAESYPPQVTHVSWIEKIN